MYYLVTIMQYENGEVLQRVDFQEVLDDRIKQSGDSPYLRKVLFKQVISANLAEEKNVLANLMRLTEQNAGLEKLLPLIAALQSKEKEALKKLFDQA